MDQKLTADDLSNIEEVSNFASGTQFSNKLAADISAPYNLGDAWESTIAWHNLSPTESEAKAERILSIIKEELQRRETTNG